MKFLIPLLALLALNSCNTMIGIGRDTKQGYEWTKNKIQNSGNNNNANSSGAPVY